MKGRHRPLPRVASILAQRPERLIDLDLRGTDHLAPLLDLVTLQHCELVGAAADQIETERGRTLGDIGPAERVSHLLVEAGDDRSGRTGTHHHAVPVHDNEARQCFFRRRHVGQGRPSCHVYSASARISGMWTGATSSAVRATSVPRPTAIGCCLAYSWYSGEKALCAERW